MMKRVFALLLALAMLCALMVGCAKQGGGGRRKGGAAGGTPSDEAPRRCRDDHGRNACRGRTR